MTPLVSSGILFYDSKTSSPQNRVHKSGQVRLQLDLKSGTTLHEIPLRKNLMIQTFEAVLTTYVTNDNPSTRMHIFEYSSTADTKISKLDATCRFLYVYAFRMLFYATMTFNFGLVTPKCEAFNIHLHPKVYCCCKFGENLS